MKLLLRDAVLMDADHYNQPGDILIEGERITQVGAELPCDEQTQVLSLKGCTIMPGIVDAHVHVAVNDGAFFDAHLKAWASKGVTTVRELGLLSKCSGEDFLSWLRAHQTPAHTHVVTAGKYIDVQGGYGDGHRPGDNWGNVITTTEEAIDAVAQHKQLGTGGIKIGILDGKMGQGRPRLPVETIHAMAKKARENGMWFSVHLTEAATLKWLLEHDCPISDAGHTPYDPIPEETLRKMVSEGIGMVTTNGGPDKVPKLPPQVMKTFDFEGFRKMAVGRCAQMRSNAQRLYEAGGTIAIGTDTGTDIADTPEDRQALIDQAGIPVIELRQLHEAGLPMQEIVKAATINGARLCGTERDEGTLQAGKLANLIAFPGRLTPDFQALSAVPFVINRGIILKNDL